MTRRRRQKAGREKTRIGRVVETRGRRVLVRDGEGDRLCFLAGNRVVICDLVDWVDAPGSGGKITDVRPRRTKLVRQDLKHREQVIAANLAGLLIVVSAQQPPFRAGLVDRYIVAARAAGLDAAICLNKIDQGVPEEVHTELELRRAHDIDVLSTSAKTGEGLEDLTDFLAQVSTDGAWALVGHSGVGKTSLISALLPDADVGSILSISEYWGTGQHATTRSTLYSLPGGGEIVDSPGVRTFSPGGMEAEEIRRFFPGFFGLGCHYRDCLHREGEEGCVAEDKVKPALVASYRRLLRDLLRAPEHWKRQGD
ncbi:MAG: ribosome small subunit-dependent GTPase A [Proteobacteria bacterium]|jgi:ribosome biogenesis GTPase / thiamine phosphate phosphatase|nr:ribosome small subunit-dependent GTPase A [Pseudomonadota bacterium]